MKPDLQAHMELQAHERECTIRYDTVNYKLAALDKRLWRLEAMSMTGTLALIALVVTLVVK